MFWTLILAHLIADYPLQPTWLVHAKRGYAGLTIHVCIHFVVMLLLAGAAWRTVWPFLLLLAAIHFAIDCFKNALSQRLPLWVIQGYLLDQLLHLISIILVALIIAQVVPDVQPLIPIPWSIYASGLLAATYVWFVTERVLYYSDVAYRHEIMTRMWSRMALRGVLTCGLVVMLLSLGEWVIALAALSSVNYRRRALLTDVSVAAAVAILVTLVTYIS